MTEPNLIDKLGLNLLPGDHHYRAFVGPAERYDLIGASQFNLLTQLGLRENHTLLDLGCGSLRAGRLFIPYLLPGHYFGIEPEQWLIDEGIKNEVGEDLIRLKQPSFSNETNFNLSVFNQKFDFIVAQSILSHMPQSWIKLCFAEAIKVMKQDTIFVLNFRKHEAENYDGEEWIYPGLSYYTLEHMTKLAAEQGLICKAINWPHFALFWVVLVRYDSNHATNLPESLYRVLDQVPQLENNLVDLRQQVRDLQAQLARRDGELEAENKKLLVQFGEVRQWAREMETRLLAHQQNSLIARIKKLSTRITRR